MATQNLFGGANLKNADVTVTLGYDGMVYGSEIRFRQTSTSNHYSVSYNSYDGKAVLRYNNNILGSLSVGYGNNNTQLRAVAVESSIKVYYAGTEIFTLPNDTSITVAGKWIVDPNNYWPGTTVVSALDLTGYTLTYNGNGATTPPVPTSKTAVTTFSNPTTAPTRTGYSLLGWSTNGQLPALAVGSSITSNTTVLAIWSINKPSSVSVSAYNSTNDSYTISCADVTGVSGYKFYYKRAAGDAWILMNKTIQSGTGTKFIVDTHPPSGTIYYGISCMVGAEESAVVSSAMQTCPRVTNITFAKRFSNTQTQVFFNYDVAASALVSGNWVVGDNLTISNIQKIGSGSPDYSILITHAYQSEILGYSVTANSNVTGDWGDILNTKTASISALTKLPAPSLVVSNWNSATNGILVEFPENTALQVKIGDGAWTPITLQSTNTNYTFTNPTAETHSFRAMTKGDFSTTFDSDWSEIQSTTPSLVAPLLEGSLSNDGENIVTLTASSSETIDLYEYYRGGVQLSGNTDILDSPGTYEYAVIAKRGNLSASGGNTVTITAIAPTTPAMLKPTYSKDTNKVTLNWTNTDAEKGYQIEYYVNNGSWEDVDPGVLYEADKDETSYESTAFSDIAVYRVRSKNTIGVSEWSNYKSILTHPVSLALSNVSATVNEIAGKSLVNSSIGNIVPGSLEWSAESLWSDAEYHNGIQETVTFEVRLMSKVQGVEHVVVDWTLLEERETPGAGMSTAILNFIEPNTYVGDALWLEARISAMGEVKEQEKFLFSDNPISFGDGSLTVSLYTKREDVITTLIDPLFGEDIPFYLPITHGSIEYGSVLHNSIVTLDIPFLATPTLAGATYSPTNHSVALIWSSVANATGYLVEWGEIINDIFSGWNSLVEVANNVNTYTHDFPVDRRYKVQYRVTAIGDDSMLKDSLTSNTLAIDTKPVLETPFFGAFDLSNDEVDLTIPDVAGMTSYQIYYERAALKNVADPVTGANLEVARKPISLTNGSYVVPDAENGIVTFFIEVSTRGGKSDLSPALDIDTRAGQPQGLAGSYNNSTNKITLNVTPIAGAVQYHWYHQDSALSKRYLGYTSNPTYEMSNPRYGVNTFWVVAETVGGRGAYSEPTNVSCTRTLKITTARRLSLTSTQVTFNIAPIKAQVENIANWTLGNFTINSIAVQADPKIVILSHAETTMASYLVTAANIFAALDEPLDNVNNKFTMPEMTPLLPPIWDQSITDYNISNDRVALRWSDPNLTGVTEYIIDRRVAGGAWERLATKGVGTLNHLDSKPPAGLLEYRIYANGNGQDVGWSAYSSPTTSITPSIPAPQLTATPNEEDGTIILEASVAGHTGLTFTYYRSEIINNIEQPKVLLTSSIDVIPSANTFRYYATAKTTNIVSPFSSAAEVVPVVPDTPLLVSAVYDVDKNANILTWQDVSNEFGYAIERNANLANPLGWTKIADVPANTVKYEDINPSSNEVYNYRVQATHPIYGNSAFSNIITMTPSIAAPGLTAIIDNTTGIVSLTATAPAGIAISAYSYFHEQNGVKIQIAGSGNTATYQLPANGAGPHAFFVKGRHELVTSDYSLAASVVAQKPSPPVINSIDSLYKESGYVKLTLSKLGDIYRWQNNTATKIASGVLTFTDLLPENQTGAFSYTAKSSEVNYFGQSDHSTASLITLTGTTPPLYFLTGDNNEIFGFNQTLEERQAYVEQGVLAPDQLYPEKLIASKIGSPGSFYVEVVVDGPNGRSVLGTSDTVTYNESGEHFITCEVGLVKVQTSEALYAEFIATGGEQVAPVRFRLMSEGNTYATSLWVFLLDIEIREAGDLHNTILCHGLRGIEQYNSSVRGIIPSPVPLPDPPVLDSSSNLSVQLGRVTINFSASPGATEYYLYRSKDNGPFQQRLQPISTFRFVDNLGTEADGLPHTYSYMVKAKNILGFSRNSNIKTFSYQKPGKPYLESSSVSHVDGAFTLSMLCDSGGRATNYRVFKNGSLASGGDISAASSTPPYITYYQGNKTDGAIDIYTVVAYNGAGLSLSSDEVAISNALPKAPTLEIQLNEAGQKVDLTSGSVLLQATAGDTRTAGYTFYKKLGLNGSWVKLNTTPQTSPIYENKITTTGDYYYAVASNNIIGESPKSEAVRVEAPMPTDITFLASFSEKTGWVTLTASGSYINSFTFFRRDPVTGLTVNLGTNSDGLMLNAPPAIGQWIYYCSCLNMFGATLSAEITTYVKWSGQLRAYQNGNEVLFGVKSTPVNIPKAQTPIKIDFACTDKGKTSEDFTIFATPPFLVGTSPSGPWENQANLGIINSLSKSAYFYLPEAVDESVETPMVLADLSDYEVIFDDTVGAPLVFTTSVLGMSQIQLDWSKGFNATSYELWYKSSSFDWSLLREITNPNTLSYIATNLSSGTTYQFRMRSIGEQSYSSYTAEVVATTTKPDDSTPPSTAISGNTGLWVKSATLTLSAADNLNGSGIDKTYYRINNGVGQIYSGPVTVTTQGNVNFAYWSTDQTGNVETEKSVTLKIDSYGPIINIAPPEEISGSKRITATVTDPVSGVATTQYRVDGGSWMDGTSVLISTPGNHTVVFQATDNAGNPSSQSITVSVGSTAPTWSTMMFETFEGLTALPAATTRTPADAMSLGKTWGSVATLSAGLSGSTLGLSANAVGTLLSIDCYPKDKMKLSYTLRLSSSTLTSLTVANVDAIGKLSANAQRAFVSQPSGTSGANPNNFSTAGYTWNEAKQMYLDVNGYPPLPTSSNVLGTQFSQPGVTANYAAQLLGFGIINGRWSVASCRSYDRLSTVPYYAWVDIGAPLPEFGKEYFVELEFNGKALATSFVGSDGKTYNEYFRVKITIDGVTYNPPYTIQSASSNPTGPFLTYNTPTITGAITPAITLPYPAAENPLNGGYGGWMAGTWPGSGTRGLHRIPFAQSGATGINLILDNIKLETEVTA